MLDSVEVLRELSRLAAHRGMGSANERIAAAWLDAKLRGMGYDAARQPFRTTRDNLYLLPVQAFVCAIAAICLALADAPAWVALALLSYAVAMLVAEASGHALDLSAMPRFDSQNVVTAPVRHAARTVFVTAHYDTQRGSFLFHPRFVDRLPWFLRVSYASLLGAMVAVAAGATSFLWAALIVCGSVGAVVLAAEISGRYTPGANDNGTGVALALCLASAYASRPDDFPSGCDLRFLFTGSEEAGCRGMKAFLKSHGRQLDAAQVCFVNLDNLGTGTITYLSGEGMLFYRRAGSRLLTLARNMRGQEGRELQEQANLLLPTDALPPLTLGFEAISFLGKDAAGRLGNYHWHTDTFENVDAAFLRGQQDFFEEFVKRAMAEQVS